MDNGALGGKILGAGGGGFILFYCEKEEQNKLRNALSELIEIPMEFDNTGSRIVFVE
jgi:D-glycero-alpha-D-manno-heptose-7-phosphate kinase